MNSKSHLCEEHPDFRMPSLDILDPCGQEGGTASLEEQQTNIRRIRKMLSANKIPITDIQAVAGPAVSLYKVYPARGVKSAAIRKLKNDIAISLGARGVRVVTLDDSVGIEIANRHTSSVPMKNLLAAPEFRSSTASLPVAIGRAVTGGVKVTDLAEAPHLLIAGATKQGKSMLVNAVVTSLLFSKRPSELKFVFVDPKNVELRAYEGLSGHYLAGLSAPEGDVRECGNDIVKTAHDAEILLRSLCLEMERRYKLFADAPLFSPRQCSNKLGKFIETRVRNIRDFNHKSEEEGTYGALPYLVVVIDEYGDLVIPRENDGESRALTSRIKSSLINLAQKGSAAGIHLVLTTQRPSAEIITDALKRNISTRVAFRVLSRADSAEIIDSPDADSLISSGDMLFSCGDGIERIQGGYVSQEEIVRLVGFFSPGRKNR